MLLQPLLHTNLLVNLCEALYYNKLTNILQAFLNTF